MMVVRIGCISGELGGLTRSSEVCLKVQQIHLQPYASRPEGQADPLVRTTAYRIRSSSIHSNITESGREGESIGLSRSSSMSPWAGGCLLLSKTSSPRTPLDPSLESC